MAGFNLFKGNYNKPGPGVRKDEQKKPPFIRFWEVFFRKFSKLVQLNLIFLIPVIVVCVLMVLLTNLVSKQPLLFFVPFIPIILLSPFIAGLTMITRNFAREEHAFVLSDFIDTIKKNWKQFIINGAIFYVVIILMVVAIRYYFAMSSNNWIYMIALGISIMVAGLFVFAQYYIPVMIITFDLSLKQIYKNAFIFAIVGLWRNLMVTIIFAILIFANYIMYVIEMPLTILIATLLILLIAFSFASYLINFVVYPLIEKMMIKPYYEKQNAPVVENTTANEPKEFDETQADTSDEKATDSAADPEYVFVNGKLVKKPADDEAVFKDRT